MKGVKRTEYGVKFVGLPNLPRRNKRGDDPGPSQKDFHLPSVFTHDSFSILPTNKVDQMIRVIYYILLRDQCEFTDPFPKNRT